MNDVIIVGQLKRIILLQLEPLLRKLTKGPVLHTIATLSRRVSNQKLTNRHDILESWHDCIQSINIVAMLYRFSSFSCYLVRTRFHKYYENFIHSMHDRPYLYIRIVRKGHLGFRIACRWKSIITFSFYRGSFWQIFMLQRCYRTTATDGLSRWSVAVNSWIGAVRSE